MPRKSKRPCSHPGCPNLTEEKYCEGHKLLHPDRPSSTQRGYNYRWRKVRKAYLQKHPLCVQCLAEGRYTMATVVDHIQPHRGDETLMWDESNFQALCKACHDKKTWTEDKNPVYRYKMRTNCCPGGIKISKCELSRNRRSLSHAKIKVQTRY